MHEGRAGRPVLVSVGLLLALAGCFGNDDKATPDTATSSSKPSATAPDRPASDQLQTTASADPVARGKQIYFGTAYSNTGLTCGHCHAADLRSARTKDYVAHTGYGAYTRGAWKIATQAQLDARQGSAKTLLEACNACIAAPYMNHGAQPLAGPDGDALLAYLKHISSPSAPDASPFITARADKLPPPGLTPDKFNGKSIYVNSCAMCHGSSIKDLPRLQGAKDWLNPLQVMAKVRQLDNWYNGNKDKQYALAHDPRRQLALYRFMGIYPARASTVVESPGSGGPPAPAKPAADEAVAEASPVFPENAMPFYATDILTDQEVVDVAYFVVEDM